MKIEIKQVAVKEFVLCYGDHNKENSDDRVIKSDETYYSFDAGTYCYARFNYCKVCASKFLMEAKTKLDPKLVLFQ